MLGSPQRHRRLRTELLELRCVLADITWLGAIDDNWHAPGNWSTGTVPGDGDVAIFQGGSATLYANQNNDVSIQSTKGASTLHLNGFAFVYEVLEVGSTEFATLDVQGPGSFRAGPGGDSQSSAARLAGQSKERPGPALPRIERIC